MAVDTLCVLPFIHFNLLPNGQASVCCISNDALRDAAGQPLNVRTNTLQEIWGSQALREVRAQMLAGQKPKNCRHCYRSEMAGFGSHRTGQNALFLDDDGANPVSEWTRVAKVARGELGPDMGKPWYVDLRFDNLCNLKCVICGAHSSSRIESDPVHRAWTREQPIERTPNRFNMTKWVESTLLFDELQEIGSEVRYIQLAGGEPFLSKLALKWLAHLGATGRAGEVTLKIFTNLTTFDEHIIRLLEPFRMLDITLSIDGVGPVYEYVRYPGKWSTIERNAAALSEAVKSRFRRASVNINATMSVHSAMGIVDVLAFAKAHGFGATLGNASTPEFVQTRYLPNRAKDRLDARLREFAAANPDFVHLPKQIDQWMGELRSADITAWRRWFAARRVMRFTNDMDASRGLDFRSIQPDVYDDFVAELGSCDDRLRFAQPS